MDKARFDSIKRCLEETSFIHGDVVKITVNVDTFDKNIGKHNTYTWRNEYEIGSGCSCIKCDKCGDKCHQCYKCKHKEPRYRSPY